MHTSQAKLRDYTEAAPRPESRRKSFAECVLDPLDSRLDLAGEQQRIEAAVDCAAALREIVPGGGEQPLALGRRDAFGGAAEARVCPLAHLDKHRGTAFAQHQVDFAETA